MRQSKLFKSVRVAQTLDANQMFNVILTDKSFQKWILDLNRSQLFAGENSLGVQLKEIGGGYSFVTEFLNQGRGFTFKPSSSGFGKIEGGNKIKEEGDSPFLLDKGDYYHSFNLEIGIGSFTIDSNPRKGNDNLEDKYGDNLEGLQDENVQKIIEVVREKFIEVARPLLRAA